MNLEQAWEQTGEEVANKAEKYLIKRDEAGLLPDDIDDSIIMKDLYRFSRLRRVGEAMINCLIKYRNCHWNLGYIPIDTTPTPAPEAPEVFPHPPLSE
jgi:hypothetical protein